jgi:hypothetical protein
MITVTVVHSVPTATDAAVALLQTTQDDVASWLAGMSRGPAPKKHPEKAGEHIS